MFFSENSVKASLNIGLFKRNLQIKHKQIAMISLLNRTNQLFSGRMDVSLCRRLRRLATLDRRCRLSRRSLSHRFPTSGSGLSNR